MAETPDLTSDAGKSEIELFLLKLRFEPGSRLVRSSSKEPILLDDSQTVWVVYSGHVDIFAVPVENGQVAGVRHHLFRAEAGQAAFGMDCDDRRIVLLAVGGPDTRLLQLNRSRIEEIAQDHEFTGEAASLIDRWIIGLSSAIAQDFVPQGSAQLEPVEEVLLEQGRTAHAKRNVLWVKHLDGNSQFMGMSALPLMGAGFCPISNRTWLQPVSNSKLCVVATETFIKQAPVWSGLDRFHDLALDCVTLSVVRAEQAERERLGKRAEADRLAMEETFSRLAAVLEPESATPFVSEKDARADPLLAACRLVGQALGLTIEPPPDTKGDPLRNIARASRVCYRQVVLRGQWWHADNGPLLAYLENGQPVALLPISPHSYELVNPATRTRTPVTPKVAASLAPLACVFYRSFPERALTILDLLKFGFRGGKNDLLVVALMGIATGILALLIPLAIGILFDSIIPAAERGQLVQLGLVLLVSTLAACLFQLTQNIAVLRLEGKWDVSILAAVWDRLLRLSVSFFRHYSSGDLAERAMGIDIVRRTLSGAVVSSILAATFAILNFGLLFYYDARLAWVASGLALFFVAATIAAGYIQVRYQRTLADLQGQIAGLILQFVTGIAKLRVAGVEDRAFALWAREFSAQKKVAFKAQGAANVLLAFNSAYPILTSMVIFATFTLAGDNQAKLSTGDFLAFSAAFSQILVASLAVSAALISTLNIIPIYERAQPILQTLPEVDPAQSDPGDLTGEIEVGHVVFRYKENEPLVLRDISLHVKPGQFVALVGPSGCGKSTLMRLLLGFETPQSGGIYYDGQDLTGLDVEKVRHQLGVVLQNGQLISGSIFTNIVGSSPATIDDAWQAARMVGLDEDIQQMPMGMHTVISEGGGTLSGGQRQRLLIARAIVNKPRVLFFDEATSALDNRTQALVAESLERLHATRVVVAHRLSTIVNADCIFVIDDGRVVQSGAYEELMRQEGLFAELAQRQIV